MTELNEMLEKVDEALETKNYPIDHYEVRPYNNFDYSVPRISGENPEDLIENWESSEFQSDGYLLEVFFSGRIPLDRLLYDSKTGEVNYIPFSGEVDGVKEDLVEMLEE